MKTVRPGRILHSFVACLLACIYFQFQVEPFECEYEENHPDRPETAAFSKNSLTWESFDKENAQQAFVVEPFIKLQLLFSAVYHSDLRDPHSPPSHPVRDKSPPIQTA